MNQILSGIEGSFLGVLEVVKGDLLTVRAGRAKPDLVAEIPVPVQAYGSTLKLQELAGITAPDSQTLIISPWDKNILEDISKGIAKSDLNINPVIGGDIIRISIPPLTQERRLELTKLVDKKVESGKVLLREERGRIKREIDNQKGKPDTSEDDIHRAVEELDKKTKNWEARIDQAGEEKKKELTTI